ncbi:MAG TPA: pyruvate ferredoxin oxidoreductase [Candidatus Moranbacteria bacterium]|nr:pyruvate ferredoxin oxidoreductase [Candidatus Moranbacteria bacterium]HRZ33705.1 pyruvate ferredoxin oxidoreductase [Candidatus Moranbacteria bacterium]
MDKNNKKIEAMTGGAAMAEALRQINPDVMAVYPITPQTPIIETYAKMKADGKVKTEIVQVESEHSAMSATIGASAASARAITATSSQGLLYMAEMLPIASGLRLPILMCVSSRALSAPLNIHGEHGDVMAVREAGWVQIFSENVQEAYDNTIIALKLSESIDLPVMSIMDGFHTSHTTERLEICDDKSIKNFLGDRKAEKSLLDFNSPVTFGALALQNSYFDFKLDQEEAIEKAKTEYKKLCAEYMNISGRKHGIFETYKLEDADYVIVMMGATAGTAKDVIDSLRKKEKKVGLLNIKLYRPFPYREIGREIAHVRKIAVLDRAISIGAYPPLYQDIVNSLHHAGSHKNEIASYIYGLGGRDTLQKDIEKVFKDLEEGEISNKIKYLK